MRRRKFRITPAQAARLEGCSADRVRSAIERGTLPAEITETGRAKIGLPELQQWAERTFSAAELVERALQMEL